MGPPLPEDRLDDALLWTGIALLPHAVLSLALSPGASPLLPPGADLLLALVCLGGWGLRQYLSASDRCRLQLALIWAAGVLASLTGAQPCAGAVYFLAGGCLACWCLSRRAALAFNAVNLLSVLACGAWLLSTGPARLPTAGLALQWAAGVWTLACYVWLLSSFMRKTVLITRRDGEEAEPSCTHAERVLNEARLLAEERSQRKTEFLTRMSHELRTPLNAIIGFAQVLDMEALGPLLPAQKAALSHLLHGGRHLTAVLGEILDLAQIESGKLALDPQTLRVAAIVAEVVALCERTMQEKGIQVQQQGDAALHVRADATRLRQVLFNLVSNAIKYNKRNGMVMIRWQLRWDRVRLSVSDTGNGIPLGRYDEVFQPFSRFDAEAKNIDGTGIGLVICKRLIEAMGGEIGFESAEGCGSDFWLEVPKVDAPVALAVKDAGDGEVSSVEMSALGGTVVYVENGRVDLRVMEHIFRLMPKVLLLTASDAGSGLRLVRDTRPALVLIDIDLPDMSGLRLLDEVRALPGLAALPVLAVSAAVMPADVERGLAAGFDRYIAKPIEVKDFLVALASFLAAR
jgi:signal transduction histidine kinase/CheY-like chemotaxis protein